MDIQKIKTGKSYQYYKDLPPWAKGLVVVGGIVVGYILIRQIIKKIKDEQDKLKLQQKLKDAHNELNNISNTMLASYPKSQFNGMADRLQEAFDGCDFSAGCPLGCWTTSDMSNSGQAIFSIINQLNNDRDFLELVDSFGVRTWDECGWGTGNVENKNLYEGISAELNNNEIKYLNELLKNRGIKYSF